MRVAKVYFVCFLLIVGACGAPKIPGERFKTPAGKDWYCTTICEGGVGGLSFYDAPQQLCYCTISEHVDDGDMELILKTARTIGMPIKFHDRRNIRSVDEGEKIEKNEEEEKLIVPKTKEIKLPNFPAHVFPPLFGKLKPRLQKPINTDVDTEGEPILGQMDPSIMENDPHHNVFAPPSLYGPRGRPLLPAPGFAPHPGPYHHTIAGHHNLAPVLTRSLLMNVREKLDALLLRNEQVPYQPAVTAHETESMRNTLKQITQVNVNVRPHGTTWGYVLNNLVNQLGGLLRQEAPNATLLEDTKEAHLFEKSSEEAKEGNVEEAESKEEKGVKEIKATIAKPTKTSAKVIKDEKKALEIGGKKTTIKTLTTQMPSIPVTTERVVQSTTGIKYPIILKSITKLASFEPSTEKTTTDMILKAIPIQEAKFLPFEEGDDELMVGDPEYNNFSDNLSQEFDK